MKLKVAAILVLASLMPGQKCYSQKLTSADYYAAIKKADVSKLWHNDLHQPENDSSLAALPEPPGFIGDNYQRFFEGKLISKFYLDENKQVQYDDLMNGAEGYPNNQCEAVWVSYATGKIKKCNWGDYRIPQSKALDSGDGEFAVDKKYDKFGCKNNRIAWSDSPWIEGTGQAREAENKHWWE